MPRELRCPTCFGEVFEVVSPGVLRCVTTRVVGSSPPGAYGNPYQQPVYGSCGALHHEDEWREAAAHAAALARAKADAANERDRAAQAAAERHQELEQRRDRLLRELRERGNPGLVRRRVPSDYRSSWLDKWLGRNGPQQFATVEGAWPIGTCSWYRNEAHGEEVFYDLPTGYTPNGRIVPMEHGTSGDDVHIVFSNHHLPGTVHSRRDGKFVTAPSLEMIVAALEHARASEESVGG
jgi:hypothetical protein